MSPLEHVSDVLRQLSVNPYNAVVQVDADRALDEADTRTKELSRREVRGPLHGIAVGIKDMIDVEGLPTRCGSRLFEDRGSARNDSQVVARLRELGAVIVGKVHTHEFAYGPTGDVASMGPCRNPHDETRISGGSSSGSAALVGGGQLPLTIGTDTAGSVRIPAALCGVVGLKPTYGSLSVRGIFPLSKSFDHVGIFTEDTLSAEYVWAALTTGGFPRFVDDGQREISDITVGRPTGEVWQAWDPSIAEVVEETARRFAGLNARIINVDLPGLRELAHVRQIIGGAEALATHHVSLTNQAGLYAPSTEARLLSASNISVVDYVDAQRKRREILSHLRAALIGVDCLLSPTTPMRATPIGTEPVNETNLRSGLISMTSPFNMSGLPAVSVPFAARDMGLPVGVQLVGVTLSETRLLQIAGAVAELYRGPRE